MGNIVQLKDEKGNKLYPVTVTDSVVDKNGVTLTEILANGTGGGGNIDPELLEGFIPLSRDFSDDFNNDFAR
jgi:hypothetical protein